jgi:hypothetical protein
MSYASGTSEPTDLAGTAFRHAEKAYKLHREQVLRKSRGRLRGGALATRAVDLSAVIDFSAADAAAANSASASGTDITLRI